MQLLIDEPFHNILHEMSLLDSRIIELLIYKLIAISTYPYPLGD